MFNQSQDLGKAMQASANEDQVKALNAKLNQLEKRIDGLFCTLAARIDNLGNPKQQAKTWATNRFLNFIWHFYPQGIQDRAACGLDALDDHITAKEPGDAVCHECFLQVQDLKEDQP